VVHDRRGSIKVHDGLKCKHPHGGGDPKHAVCGVRVSHAFDSSSALVYLVANSIPIYEEMCHRSFNFIQKAAAYECDLVHFVARNAWLMLYTAR
jgi:hypothetical protein